MTNQTITAKQFLSDLEKLRTNSGIRMGDIFALAKKNKEMDLGQVEELLDNPMHEARVGAVSIMDFRARDKKTSPSERTDLFNLYINKHDKINTWDLVDRSAIYIVGGYLADKPHAPLFKLAKSADPNQRRTSVVATFYFIMKQGDIEDSFKLAEILLNEKDPLTQKAVGWVLRTAGGHDPKKLVDFLDKYASKMPRATLRNAIEKMSREQKDHYMKVA